MRRKIQVGDKYSRWLVTSITTEKKRYVECVCDCGVIKLVCGSNLLRGASQSCGCLSVELTKEREKTHGKNGTKEHTIWVSMRNRCRGQGSHGFYYLERGITYAPRWESFENFLEDMGECPEGLTLDRIDNNLGYYKENCQWADSSQQASNRRKNKSNTSGRIGVFWAEDRQRWRVQIVVQGKRINIGHFICYEKACEAIEKAEMELLGYSRKDY